MATKSKSLPIPVIAPGCKVQVINENTFRWETIAECFDAPNPIAVVLKKHKLRSAWVVDCLGCRRMVFAK